MPFPHPHLLHISMRNACASCLEWHVPACLDFLFTDQPSLPLQERWCGGVGEDLQCLQQILLTKSFYSDGQWVCQQKGRGPLFMTVSGSGVEWG